MSRQVLLVMDVQVTVVGWIAEGERYAQRLATAVAAARRHAIPVVHVIVVHRDGHPEVRPGNRFFAQVVGTPTLTESDPGSRIHPAVEPHPREPVVVKRYVSAFSGSDLGTLLDGMEADSLVLSGLGTSGVVFSTMRDGTERQYDMTILRDGCDDVDAEVHRALTEKVFPREATVMSIDDWISEIENPRT